MSDFYVKGNSEGSRDTFNKKILYKFDTIWNSYSNLVDFTFAEKQLYGRVSRLFEPIVVKDYVLELKSIIQASDPKRGLKALNFVSDAFNDLAKTFQKKVLKAEIDSTDKNLANLKAHKAYQDPHYLYKQHLSSYKEAVEELFEEDSVRFVSFEKFVALLTPYIFKTCRRIPFTLPAYVKSHYCPANVSGLVIEIADMDPSNDAEKIEKFYNSKNWQFFLNACAEYGFMVDKNIPWRIVADIGSAPMLEYAGLYGVTDTDSVLHIGYEKAHKGYFQVFKQIMYEMYHRLKQDVYYEVSHVQTDGTQLIENFPSTYTSEYFFSIYDDYYFLDLYCRIRFKEEESSFSAPQQDNIIDNCIEISRLDLNRGLNSFENILNKTFDYIGSLTYISNRLRELEDNPLPNDAPDVQLHVEPIEEMLSGGDGALDDI